MRLSPQQIEHVADQLHGHAIPDEHPNTPQLKEAFGDHTFFLSEQGLHIVEPEGNSGRSDGSVLRVGSWSEDKEGHLVLHEPQSTHLVTLDPWTSGDQ